MKILLTFDTGYAPHAATVMESIIQNCPEKLDFAVIYYDLNEETRNILSHHFQGKVSSLVFYRLDEQVLKNAIKDIKTAGHLTGFNTYLRLFAPVLLKDDNHVVYLDCDIVVRENILKITQDADLTKPLCAVTEYDPKYKLRNLANLQPHETPMVNPLIYEAYWYRAYKDLKMHEDAKYFNAGVMVINLAYWREYGIGEKALKFLVENPEKAFSADQDALNYVLNGNFHSLHPKWNNVVVGYGVFSNYSAEELAEATVQSTIIHAAGPVKPWCYLGGYQREYKKYRKFTPWGKIEFKDKTMPKVIKKWLILPIVQCLKKLIVRLVGKKRKHLLASFLNLNKSANLFFAGARNQNYII